MKQKPKHCIMFECNEKTIEGEHFCKQCLRRGDGYPATRK